MDILKYLEEISELAENKEIAFQEKYFRIYYCYFCSKDPEDFKRLCEITDEEMEIARVKELHSPDFLLFANRMFLLTIIMWSDVNRFYEVMKYFYENE